MCSDSICAHWCAHLFVCLGTAMLLASPSDRDARREGMRLCGYTQHTGFHALSSPAARLRLLSLLNAGWHWDFPKCHQDEEVGWKSRRKVGSRDGLVIVQHLFITALAPDISLLCPWSTHTHLHHHLTNSQSSTTSNLYKTHTHTSTPLFNQQVYLQSILNCTSAPSRHLHLIDPQFRPWQHQCCKNHATHHKSWYIFSEPWVSQLEY